MPYHQLITQSVNTRNRGEARSYNYKTVNYHAILFHEGSKSLYMDAALIFFNGGLFCHTKFAYTFKTVEMEGKARLHNYTTVKSRVILFREGSKSLYIVVTLNFLAGGLFCHTKFAYSFEFVEIEARQDYIIENGEICL